MRVSYVAPFNALDVQSWSGTGYYMGEMFKLQGVDLHYINNLRKTIPVSAQLILKLQSYLLKGTGKSYAHDFMPLAVREYARVVQSSVPKDTDVIFSAGSMPIALTKTTIPKAFYTDATYAGLDGFYDNYSRFPLAIKKKIHEFEKQAIGSSNLAIYSSDWAANTAIEYYNADPSKVKVVPFGANIECDRNLDDIKLIISKRSCSECQLLFLGVDWKRKGGDLAMAVAGRLNAMGLKTVLHVVGIRKMPYAHMPGYVINHGFISKRTAEGKKMLEQLFKRSHFLILPSQAEAYGIAFCEANSFALPCLATNVGGIPTIIKDDINGKIFGLLQDENGYAEYIYNTFSNYERYKSLAMSSFHEYESRLNWKVAGKKIMTLLKEL
ncbi:MAG: glycosyltransferase family 4 protein [Chitinophagaceae bacterium]|nr:glycosyltransferase family 4 protein [Chitinophagaceae bacterium]